MHVHSYRQGRVCSALRLACIRSDSDWMGCELDIVLIINVCLSYSKSWTVMLRVFCCLEATSLTLYVFSWDQTIKFNDANLIALIKTKLNPTVKECTQILFVDLKIPEDWALRNKKTQVLENFSCHLSDVQPSSLSYWLWSIASAVGRVFLVLLSELWAKEEIESSPEYRLSFLFHKKFGFWLSPKRLRHIHASEVKSTEKANQIVGIL